MPRTDRHPKDTLVTRALYRLTYSQTRLINSGQNYPGFLDIYASAPTPTGRSTDSHASDIHERYRMKNKWIFPVQTFLYRWQKLIHFSLLGIDAASCIITSFLYCKFLAPAATISIDSPGLTCTLSKHLLSVYYLSPGQVPRSLVPWYTPGSISKTSLKYAEQPCIFILK